MCESNAGKKKDVKITLSKGIEVFWGKHDIFMG